MTTTSEKKVYGYVIIHKETGEQWGGAYSSKAGAALAYNHHFNSTYYRIRGDRHKFSEQDTWIRKALVIADD